MAAAAPAHIDGAYVRRIQRKHAASLRKLASGKGKARSTGADRAESAVVPCEDKSAVLAVGGGGRAPCSYTVSHGLGLSIDAIDDGGVIDEALILETDMLACGIMDEALILDADLQQGQELNTGDFVSHTMEEFDWWRS